MKSFLLIFSFVCVVSCATHHLLQKQYADAETTLLFYDDSTFEYKYFFAHHQEYSKGSFRQVAPNQILMNSNILDRTVRANVSERPDSKNIVSVYLFDGSATSRYKCQIFINDTLYQSTGLHKLTSTGLDYIKAEKEINMPDLYVRYIRADSLIELETNTLIKSIVLKVIKLPSLTSTEMFSYPILTNKYFTTSPSSKAIEVRVPVNDSLFNYRIFLNERLRISSKAVEVSNRNTNKWIKIPVK